MQELAVLEQNNISAFLRWRKKKVHFLQAENKPRIALLYENYKINFPAERNKTQHMQIIMHVQCYFQIIYFKIKLFFSFVKSVDLYIKPWICNESNINLFKQLYFPFSIWTTQGNELNAVKRVSGLFLQTKLVLWFLFNLFLLSLKITKHYWVIRFWHA